MEQGQFTVVRSTTVNPSNKKVPPPVAAKPKKSSSADPATKDVMVPPSSPKLDCLDEIDLLTNVLMASLESAGDPNFIATCFKCFKAISKDQGGCNAMNNTYHVACLLCDICKSQLVGKEFHVSEERSLCEDCYMSTLKDCYHCSKKITDRIIYALEKSYHGDCFLCSSCSTKLDGEPYTVNEENETLCLNCFHQRYAPTCASCKKLIIPTEQNHELLHIVSMNKDFHIGCFNCLDCGTSLADPNSNGCFPLDDMILCQQCNWNRLRDFTKAVRSNEETQL